MIGHEELAHVRHRRSDLLVRDHPDLYSREHLAHELNRRRVRRRLVELLADLHAAFASGGAAAAAPARATTACCFFVFIFILAAFPMLLPAHTAHYMFTLYFTRCPSPRLNLPVTCRFPARTQFHTIPTRYKYILFLYLY